MNIIYTAILLFCDVFMCIIFIDVILSWLTVLGINIRFSFISDILDPIYESIKKYIPVNFWPFLFTPIILLFIIYFIKGLIYALDPTISSYYSSLLSII